MMYRVVIALFMSSIAVLAASGCSADKDCVSLCEEAQAGDCTAIEGDCTAFCNALDDLGACESQREDYEACLNEESAVCDANCNSSESALIDCGIAFCSQNPTNADCLTLAASY